MSSENDLKRDFPKYKWGSFSDEESEVDAEDEDDEVEETKTIVVDTLQEMLDIVVDQSLIKDEEAPTCCYFLEEADLGEKCLSYFQNLRYDSQVSCLANTVSNLCNAILQLKTYDVTNDVKYSIIDKFLRTRHDLLHDLAMDSLNLKIEKTDQSFSETFDFMDSHRTPDRIIVEDMKVTIIETTATLNVFKGYIGKGKMEEGFKSKYESEIFTLQNHDYVVNYVVLIFDVKDPQNTAYISDVKKISESTEATLNEDKLLKIDLIRSVYCNYSEEITRLYSNEVTNLLNERFDIEKVPTSLDFLMKPGPSKHKKYNRIGLSTFVYNKLCNSWPRFPIMLERAFLDYEGNILPFYEHSNSKFGFVKRRSGVSYDKLMDIILYDDKPGFSKLLLQMIDGTTFNSDRADLEFFDTSAEDTIEITQRELKQTTHLSSKPWVKLGEPADFKHLEAVEIYKNMHHKYEDPNYEDKLISKMKDFYKNVDESNFDDYMSTHVKKPFATYDLNEEVIHNAVIKYGSEVENINRMQPHSNVMRYQKQPFLYPLINASEMEHCGYKSPPLKALKVIGGINVGPYTKMIVEKIGSNFTWGSHTKELDPKLQELQIELRNVQNEVYKKQVSQIKALGLKKFPKLSEMDGMEDYKKKLTDINKKINLAGGSSNRKSLSIVRLPCKGKNSMIKSAFNDEMSHYKNKKSSSLYKGVGILNYEELLKGFLALKIDLKNPMGTPSKDNILHDFVSDDVTLLKQLKTDYMTNFEPRLSFLKSTGLYASCAMVSRFCHTLAFLSQTTLSSDYISVDNLGFDGVLLFVRGGKKVFKTKQSKLFRILYPVNDCIVEWYSSGSFQTSVTLHRDGPTNYLLTPWHTLDETVMNDGITFLHKTMSYILLSHESDVSLAYDKCFFNIMLSFHNRRKTEELLHNIRYICVNSISDVSRLDLMLPELAGFNYDFFQAFIRSAISANFEDFSIKLLNFNKMEKTGKDYFKNVGLCSIFDCVGIDNLEDLTMTIYSTFLMSKSPTNQALEQVKNLKSMLKTYMLHEQESSDLVEEQYDMNAKTISSTCSEYWNQLNESDFNFDPAYCNLLGKFSSDYLSNIINKNEVNVKWMKIVNENWDNFANTKGLRGMEESTFFNKKGYFVVYDYIMKNDIAVDKVRDILISDMDDFKKRKKLNELNLKYKTQLGCKSLDKVIFHVVDKKQRGGSREIFVMDLQTKINQQAIEKFLAYLCKLIPNEAISVPSNRRLQHIHATVFERFKQEDLTTYNLTLDCRKWAPHSVMNKFVDLILGMANFLPDTFITHFLIFFSKMFTKKIYTRDYIVKIMKTNEGLRKNIERIMIPDEAKKGFYFNMSYSWVMGIFNYMSSFMHVMNQLHASHIIMKVSMSSQGVAAYYHMNAHSDDSGGKMQVSDRMAMKKTFYLYEMLLKSCNHLLSDKKCNISKKYFEFLSVLYINNTLLSLITKLSGAFTFHPTDGGYCGDVNECYGKCIELITNGATFDQAYISLKVMSHLVFKFYFNRDPSVSDYNLPPQLLGVPDPHPLIAMISGSDSDIIRLTSKDSECFDKFSFLSSTLSKDVDLSTDCLKPISVEPNIKLSDDLKKHSDIIDLEGMDEDLLWIIRNSDIKNTGLMLYKYGLMLRNKKFAASLIDETLTRRISRAYYFRSSNILQTPWGNTSYKTLKTVINLFMSEPNPGNFLPEWEIALTTMKDEFDNFKNSNSKMYNLYELMNSEVYSFVESLNKISYTPDCIVDSKKTVKPIHVNMQKTNLPTADNFNPSNLAIWIKMPEYRWLITMGDDYKNKTQQLTNFLERHDVDIDMIDINWLHNLLRKLKGKFVKEYFIYSNMPHDFRDVSTYKDFLGFLAHNSIKNKHIEGISMPYGVSMSQPMNAIFKDSMSEDLQKALTFINYCFSLTNDFKLFQEVASLDINSQILGCVNTKLYDLLKELYSLWEGKMDFGEIVCPHIKCLLSYMDNDLHSAPWLSGTYYYSFVKNQRLIGNVWLGKGLLYINTPRLKMEMEILNTKISGIKANHNLFTFKQFEIAYVNSVLINANLGRVEDLFNRIDHSSWDKVAIGLDSGGNVCITQKRFLKLAFNNFTYQRTIVNKASRLETAEITINKNFSYDCISRHELYENEKCALNVFKIDPSSMLELLITLYDSERNREMVESKGDIFKQYMKMFVGSVSGVDLTLHIDQLFDLFQSSRLYKIMSDLVKKDKLSQNTIKLRKHIYPAQEGGLLSALIEYKHLDPAFMFDYEKILSPEMMSLKSTQPEAFMSNLVTNLKEKFNQLYNGEDKESIKRDLLKLAEIMDSDKYHSKLLSLLTTWGYIGVMGSLEEMNFVKKRENYRTIRYRGENSIYGKFNESALIDLIDALAISTKKHNYFTDMTYLKNSGCFWYCKSWLDFQKTMISLVHSYVLNCYKVSSKYLTHTPNIEFIKIFNTVQILCQDQQFCDSLMEEMQTNPMIMLLLVDKNSAKDLMIIIETLLNDFMANNKQDVQLLFDTPVQHDHDLIQPYTLTKRILSNTKLGFNLKMLNFHGFISRDQFKFFKSNKFFPVKDQMVNVNFELGELSEVSIPFNKFYFINNKFVEGFEDEDEYYDVNMELESDEPDIDELENALGEAMVGNYKRRMRLRYKDSLSYRPYYDVKVFFMPSLKSDPTALNFVRNSGTTILLITDLYLTDLVEQMDDRVKIFSKINPVWENKTLIDPECMLYYLMDYEEVNTEEWEVILNAREVSKSQLMTEKNAAPTNLIIIDNGDLKVVDRYMSLDDKINLMKTEQKEEVEDDDGTFDEKTKTIEDAEADVVKKLKSEGYDLEFIDLIKTKIRSFKSRDVGEILTEAIVKYLTSAKLMETIKMGIKEGSKKVLSELEDVKQATQIFEVASVFSVGAPNKSSIKNRCLKESAVRAEINSFYDNLSDYILSGTLSISPEEYKTLGKFCKAMRRYAMMERHDREKKLFLIDVLQLIANDAYQDKDGGHDFMFQSMRDKLTNKIVTDDDDDEFDFTSTYAKDSGHGRINYNW